MYKPDVKIRKWKVGKNVELFEVILRGYPFMTGVAGTRYFYAPQEECKYLQKADPILGSDSVHTRVA
jgi:hypothetical protein